MKRFSKIILIFMAFLMLMPTTAIEAANPSIKLKGKGQVGIGKKITLKAVTTPKNAAVKWSTSNGTILKVSKTGVVTGKKIGKATVKACLKDNPKVCTTKVINVLPVLTLSTPDGKSVKVLEKITLTAQTKPKKMAVKWSSSNKKQAEITGTKVENNVSKATIQGVGKTEKNKEVTIKVCVVKHPKVCKSVKITVTGSSDPTPTPSEITSLTLDGSSTVALKKTIKLSAETNLGSVSDATTLNWSSDTTQVAVVDDKGVVQGLMTGKATIKACAKDPNYACGTWLVEVTAGVAASGGEVKIKDEGDGTKLIDKVTKETYQLSASVTPSSLSQEVTWSSSDPEIATVDENGLVTATGEGTGTVTITASAADGSGASDSVEIEVVIKVQAGSLKITPDSASIGVDQTIGLTVSFEQDPLPDNTDVNWTSKPEGIVSVSDGEVTGLKAGTAKVQACSDQENPKVCSNEAEIKVVPVAEGVTIVDEEDGSKKIDIASDTKTYKLSATVDPSEALQEVTWSSNDETIATVDGGTVTGIKSGTVKITATTADGTDISASVTIEVVAAVQSGSIKVSGPENVAQGKTITLTAEFTQTVPPDNKEVIWTSESPTIATVTNTGVVTGKKGGSAVITACSEEISTYCDSMTVSVTPAATGITVDRHPDQEITGMMIDLPSDNKTYKLQAKVTPSTASQEVTWESNNNTVATVDENGVVTGVALGHVKITATTTDGTGLSASYELDIVSKPQKAGMKVTGETTVVKGKKISLGVTFEQDPAPENTNVTWTSDATAIAAVNSSGVVTGKKVGTAKITACSEQFTDVCADLEITVAPVAESIAITEADDQAASKKVDIAGDNTYKLVAKVTPAEALQDATWSSSDETIATVDGGTVTGVKTGAVTITATTTDGTNLSATYDLTVVSKVQPGSLKVTGEETVDKGADITLAVEFTQSPQPENKKVSWSSSNTDIATVSTAGKVTGVKGGTVTIEACSKEDSSICGTLDITVIAKAETVTIKDGGDGSKTIDRASSDPTYQLNAEVGPEDATNKDVTWSSNNENVATVDSSGMVTAGSVSGTAKITATAADGSGVKKPVTITVVSNPHKIKVEGEDTVVQNGVITLTASFDQLVEPDEKGIKWSSMNSTIAQVGSTSGKVTGNGGGTAKIKACSTAAGFETVCGELEVKVIPLATGITITDEGDGSKKIDLAGANTYKLSASVTPSEASQEVEWSSSKTSVATVADDGTVTGLSSGSVTITATAKDGSGVKKTFALTVVSNPHKIKVEGEETVLQGGDITLTASFDQSVEPDDKGIKWTSTKTGVATVGSSSGKVTGKSGGTATIKACSTATGFETICGEMDITVIPLAESITITDEGDGSKKIDLAGANTYKLSASVSPTEASQEVEWSSTSRATVADDGTVTGVSLGAVTITATAKDGSDVKKTFGLVVVSKVQPGSLKITGETEIEKNSKFWPKVTFNQDPQPQETGVTITSDNTSVATISSSNAVVGKGEGKATITACSVEDSSICDSFEVNVVLPAEGSETGSTMSTMSMSMPQPSVSIVEGESGTAAVGEEFTLHASAAPEDVLWISSDDTVASVDAEGVVTPLKEGTAVVAAAVPDENGDMMMGTYMLTVSAAPAAAMADAAAPEAAAETAAEPAAEPAEAVKPSFASPAIELKSQESAQLEVVNTDGADVIVGIYGDTDKVLWDEANRVITGVFPGEVTAYIAAADTLEVLDYCVVTVSDMPAAAEVQPEAPAAAEPVTEYTEEPDEEPFAEAPAPETAEEPAADEPVEEPVIETVEEPVIETVEEPVVETVEEPSAETVEEPEELILPEFEEKNGKKEASVYVGVKFELEELFAEDYIDEYSDFEVVFEKNPAAVSWNKEEGTVTAVTAADVKIVLKAGDPAEEFDAFLLHIIPVPTEVPAEEPVAEPVEEPAAEAVAEPAPAAVEEPAAEPVEEPAAETVEEAAAETVEETAEETVEETVEEAVEEPVEEPAAEPAEEVTEG